MLPSRPPGTPAAPSAARKSGPIAYPQAPYETVKRRVLLKLEERLDMSASKRMPQSLLRQSLRKQADQIADIEARGLSKSDRERMIEEVLGELFGYGPLDELFADPTVREVMVTGPGAVIVRREQWIPTSVKFRDEEHVRLVLDRIASHAEAVGPVMASMTVFDMKLANGFRAIAVIPPGALGQPATASFLREPIVPALKDVSKDSAPVAPRSPGSALQTVPAPRTGPTDGPLSGERDPIARHRARILERLLVKFASLGLYDASRLDVNELRKVISAYVAEYGTTEKIYLSDPDQGRLTLEILTALLK